LISIVILIVIKMYMHSILPKATDENEGLKKSSESGKRK